MAGDRNLFDSVHPLIRGYDDRLKRVQYGLNALNEAHADHRRTISFGKLPDYLSAAIDLAHLTQPNPELEVTCAVSLEDSPLRGYEGYPNKSFRCFTVGWDVNDDLAIARLWVEERYPTNLEDDDHELRRVRSIRARKLEPALGKAYMARALVLTDHLTHPKYSYYKIPLLEELLRITNPAIPVDQLKPGSAIPILGR